MIKKFCLKENITLKFPNDVFVNKKQIFGILQEILTFNEKKFLIIGIGLNVSSNPNINTKYKTTNIMSETKNKPQKDVKAMVIAVLMDAIKEALITGFLILIKLLLIIQK